MTELGQSHFLGGSPLNRLSWLRSSPAFLSLALESPRTKWLLFDDGQPLVTVSPAPSQSSSATPAVPSPSSPAPKPRTKTIPTFLSTFNVRSLLGPAPYFAQGQHPGSTLPPELITTEHNGKGKFLESARIHGPTIVFLGTLESKQDSWLGRPASDYSKMPETPEGIIGDPYFALDVTEVDQQLLKDTFKLGVEREGGIKEEFGDPRAAGLSFEPMEAAIFSEGRTMIDWNSRMKFCPSCGSGIHSLWGGWKLSCSSLLPWADNTGKKPCPTAKGLHNVMHPRTDAVVITAVLDETGDRILLGRNKRFPPGFYSTLAGFLEPSESLEDAVSREIWEESGIHVTNVRYHSCQPWPYPANLMVGCYAIADSSQTIRTDLDNELEDARWFTREEVLLMLSDGPGLKKKEMRDMGRQVGDQKLLAPAEDSKASPGSDSESDGEEGAKRKRRSVVIRVPGKQAIAGVLIYKWAHRQLDGLGYSFIPAKQRM